MSTTVAKSKSRDLKTVLSDELVMAQIQRALPNHMDADRMARIAITAATRTPKLNQCTIESVMKCLLDLSALGLEPDGRMAHLIPYGKECTLIVDYKGLVALAYRSGEVKSIHADVVYSGDSFRYFLGKVKEHEKWEFRVDTARPPERGDVIAAYCVVELKGGAEKHEVMTIGELDSIQSRSKAGSSGPWKSDRTEMQKKTVFRRASKWIPLSSEFRNHFERDFDSLPPIETRQVRRSHLNDIMPNDDESTEFSTDTIKERLASAKTADEVIEIGDAMISEGADSDTVSTFGKARIAELEAK